MSVVDRQVDTYDEFLSDGRACSGTSMPCRSGCVTRVRNVIHHDFTYFLAASIKAVSFDQDDLSGNEHRDQEW